MGLKLNIMGFQILDINKQPIPINRLDEEVCKLWKVPVLDDKYARPKPRSAFPEGFKGTWDFICQPNWYDNLAYRIHRHGYSTWEEIRNDYAAEVAELTNEFTWEQIYPEFKQLIDYWEAKGYTPRQVGD